MICVYSKREHETRRKHSAGMLRITSFVNAEGLRLLQLRLVDLSDLFHHLEILRRAIIRVGPRNGFEGPVDKNKGDLSIDPPGQWDPAAVVFG